MRAKPLYALLLAGILACKSPADVPSNVDVFATLSHNSASLGETVTATITIRNSSHEVVLISGSSSCLAFLIGVRRMNGNEVTLADPRICNLDYRKHPLASNQEFVERVRLVLNVDNPSLEAGEYRVRGGVILADYGAVWSEYQQLTVLTPGALDPGDGFLSNR